MVFLLWMCEFPTMDGWLSTNTQAGLEDIQDTALSHSSGTTTLTLRQAQSHSNKHRHSQCVIPPHLKYDRNTLGIYGTTTLGLIHRQNGAKRVGQNKNLLKLYHFKLYKIC